MNGGIYESMAGYMNQWWVVFVLFHFISCHSLALDATGTALVGEDSFMLRPWSLCIVVPPPACECRAFQNNSVSLSHGSCAYLVEPSRKSGNFPTTPGPRTLSTWPESFVIRRGHYKGPKVMQRGVQRESASHPVGMHSIG